MLRCRQTAEILFPGVEQRLVDALKECDFGTFEGKTWAELKDDPINQAWLAGDPHIAFPGGEVLGEHIARCRRGVAHVVEQARALGMSRPWDSGPRRDPDVRYVRLCGATSGFLQLAAQQLRRISGPGGGGGGHGLHPD